MGGAQWIMHLDLDAFFAAVEQRDKPSLRGKPVIVGGIGNRGVVATASYEARAFGVRSAMNTVEARRKCPQAAVLAGRFDAYTAESHNVMDVLREISPQIELLSLDEAYVDLSHLDLDYGDLAPFAAEVLTKITTVTGGLTASIGIASSKLLAKIASELNKPNGSFVVAPGTDIQVLDPLPIRALPGIGPAAESRLNHVGVTHVKHVRGFEQLELQDLLGDAAGSSLWRMVRAIDARKVESHRVRKSIGIEDTFGHDVQGLPSLHDELQNLVNSLVTRMAHRGISGRTISVKLRDSTFHTTTKSSTLDAATHSLSVISDTAHLLLEALEPRSPVRLLGVSVSGLSPWIQGDLFEQDVTLGEEETLSLTAAPSRSPHKPATWITGMDVHHAQHGDGWVWGSGLGRVTVRFETRNTAPGPIHTFNVEDPLLSQGHWATFDS